MPEDGVVTEAFTRLAPDYTETMDIELNQFWGIGYQEFVSCLVDSASLRPGERVLDIATGTAAIPIEISRKVKNHAPVVGLDLTPAMLRHGREGLVKAGGVPAIHLVCASGLAMPFRAGAFDVLLCGLGTHHMDVPQLLAEAGRVLAKGGRLVITDVGASRFWRSLWGRLLLRVLLFRYGLLEGSARARAEVEAFHNVRTADEWRELLGRYGFRRIEVNELQARRPWYPCALRMKAELGTG